MYKRQDVANLWIVDIQRYMEAAGARQYFHPVRVHGLNRERNLEMTYGIRWGTYGQTPPTEMPKSGLYGPVRLVPMKRVRATL